jgi:hypothetical protein
VLEEFEDTKGVIRIRKSKKNRQHKRVTLSCIVTDGYNQQPSFYYIYHAWICEIFESDKGSMELTPGKHIVLVDSGIVELQDNVTRLCCLFFFDLRILITPLVSSNSSNTLRCSYRNANITCSTKCHTQNIR